ncbi:MAG: helix-turn-helix domain-containing protein, partial [Actinomycetota bacterium]
MRISWHASRKSPTPQSDGTEATRFVAAPDESPSSIDLARRAAFASHQLIGWIYWDPRAAARHAELGVKDGLGHYIANRAAPL